jgi:antitoxin (DNA-binding transcriptional repressor) of toxin-antitoxin stability system
METIAVDKIETCFQEILEEVRLGKKVSILCNGIKAPVAMIVPCIEEKKDTLRMRRQKLIRYPDRYEPLALAGAIEDNSPLDLAQIRRGWTKKK